jgi:thiol peroxidase
MAQERPNAFDFAGTKTTLLGPELRAGDRAPDFEAIDQGLKPVRLADTAGKVRIFASVPSLDTGVCDIEAKRFNQEVGKLGDAVACYVVSMDLPFAQKRWCGAADANNIRTLSDHRSGSFGQAFGTLQKENRILSRAVFVVDSHDRVVYAEYVPAAGQQPNYDATIEAARAAR